MKKILTTSLFALFVLVGCGDKTPPPAPVDNPVANKCFVDAPSWVVNGGAEGGLSSVGAAPITNNNIQFARTMAMANARDEMARTMSVKVQNMLKDFTQVTGVGDAAVMDRVSASVSKQIANQTLTGTVQKAIWSSPCNEIYVLVGADPNTVSAYVKDSVTSSFRNDNALWQQFQAQKAQDELDAAISKEFSNF